MPQDLPPLQGYEPIQWKRNLPSRGFRPSIFLLGLAGFCGYGWYIMMKSIRERRELKREKIWSRFYLFPLLQAEADRDSVRRYFADLEREREIMKDVPGWEAGKSVYNDGRFRQPALSIVNPPK